MESTSKVVRDCNTCARHQQGKHPKDVRFMVSEPTPSRTVWSTCSQCLSNNLRDYKPQEPVAKEEALDYPEIEFPLDAGVPVIPAGPFDPKLSLRSEGAKLLADQIDQRITAGIKDDVGLLGRKSTNPKDILASDRVPLGLVPATAMAHYAVAHYDGAVKYGPWNWRSESVSAMTYLHAALRHLEDWANREDYAQDSKAHHLAHAGACLNILLDAIETGVLIDDRPARGADVAALHERLRGTVQSIIARERAKSQKNQ